MKDRILHLWNNREEIEIDSPVKENAKCKIRKINPGTKHPESLEYYERLNLQIVSIEEEET